MLQPEVRHVVAQTVEKVIVAIVLRSKKRVRLRHQILIMLPNIGGRIERGGAVGCNVHLDWRCLPWIQGNDFQILSRDYGRIHQSGE